MNKNGDFRLIFGAVSLTLLMLFISQNATSQESKSVKEAIATNLDAWHEAAANAEFETYFGLMTPDGVFIGTDAEENWQNKEFRAYAKPHFDRGKAWSFHALERNIYLAEDQKLAWFDELLDTQMGVLRGSGVVVKQDGSWKIKHYVLSFTVPNEHVEAVKSIKNDHDKNLIEKLKG